MAAGCRAIRRATPPAPRSQALLDATGRARGIGSRSTRGCRSPAASAAAAPARSRRSSPPTSCLGGRRRLEVLLACAMDGRSRRLRRGASRQRRAVALRRVRARARVADPARSSSACRCRRAVVRAAASASRSAKPATARAHARRLGAAARCGPPVGQRRRAGRGPLPERSAADRAGARGSRRRTEARATWCPAFAAVKQAAHGAGALGCSLSGSGPSIFALVRIVRSRGAGGAGDARRVRAATGLDADLWVSPRGRRARRARGCQRR